MTPLEHALCASLAAVCGPPPQVLEAHELPTAEQLAELDWHLELLVTPGLCFRSEEPGE